MIKMISYLDCINKIDSIMDSIVIRDFVTLLLDYHPNKSDKDRFLLQVKSMYFTNNKLNNLFVVGVEKFEVSGNLTFMSIDSELIKSYLININKNKEECKENKEENVFYLLNRHELNSLPKRIAFINFWLYINGFSIEHNCLFHIGGKLISEVLSVNEIKEYIKFYWDLLNYFDIKDESEISDFTDYFEKFCKRLGYKEIYEFEYIFSKFANNLKIYELIAVKANLYYNNMKSKIELYGAEWKKYMIEEGKCGDDEKDENDDETTYSSLYEE